MTINDYIESGKAVLGIELGSTRIKAVLIGEDFSPIASGSHEWENSLKNNLWTYSLEEVKSGIQDAFSDLKKDVSEKYGVKLTKISAMGFSAMMHGFLAFDKNGTQLGEFRTWRNTNTGEAAAILTEKFNFNIPLRWSISHLYQVILGQEPFAKDIAFMTTLAGYVHMVLTGEKVLGVGDASGMFPIDSAINDYDRHMAEIFDGILAENGMEYKLFDILPKVLTAGENAGVLTKEGALYLDPTGELEAGCPVAPPEGDAGTGMTATNSVAVRTGNVSAGTSVFSMSVIEKPLKKVHPEIDMVTTPTGKPCAMVHVNNCTSDINAYAKMFVSAAEGFGFKLSYYDALSAIFAAAAKGKPDCDNIISIGYFSGEPVTGLSEGRPLLARSPESEFSFQNLSRSLLYSACAALKIGNDILFEDEGVTMDKFYGHGGFFKAKGVGQSVMANALGIPVSVMETAGEGGPWGMALLASYLINKDGGETLEKFLENKVFANSECSVITPDDEGKEGFNKYIKSYSKLLEAEKAAVNAIEL